MKNAINKNKEINKMKTKVTLMQIRVHEVVIDLSKDEFDNYEDNESLKARVIDMINDSTIVESSDMLVKREEVE